jgi:hypothetical protein
MLRHCGWEPLTTIAGGSLNQWVGNVWPSLAGADDPSLSSEWNRLLWVAGYRCYRSARTSFDRLHCLQRTEKAQIRVLASQQIFRSRLLAAGKLCAKKKPRSFDQGCFDEVQNRIGRDFRRT